MTSLSSFETKEYLLPHLMLKEGVVGVSESKRYIDIKHGNLSMDVTPKGFVVCYS